MNAGELEILLRKIVREELQKVLGADQAVVVGKPVFNDPLTDYQRRKQAANADRERKQLKRQILAA